MARSATPTSSAGSNRMPARCSIMNAMISTYAIETSCQMKAEIVSRDEREAEIARSSISGTLSVMRSKPGRGIPARSCMARPSRSAWRSRASFHSGKAIAVPRQPRG